MQMLPYNLAASPYFDLFQLLVSVVPLFELLEILNTFGLKKNYQYQYQYLLVQVWAIQVPMQ